VSHASKVVVIDIGKDTIVGEIGPTPGIHGIAFAPELGLGFITCGSESKAAIFDLKTLQITSKVDAGGTPDAVLYEPGRQEVYTFNHRTNDSTVFEAKTGKIVATIKLSGVPEFAQADSKAGRVYNNIEDKNEVAVIDTKTHTVVATWPIAPAEGTTPGFCLLRALSGFVDVLDGAVASAAAAPVHLGRHDELATVGCVGVERVGVGDLPALAEIPLHDELRPVPVRLRFDDTGVGLVFLLLVVRREVLDAAVRIDERHVVFGHGDRHLFRRLHRLGHQLAHVRRTAARALASGVATAEATAAATSTAHAATAAATPAAPRARFASPAGHRTTLVAELMVELPDAVDARFLSVVSLERGQKADGTSERCDRQDRGDHDELASHVLLPAELTSGATISCWRPDERPAGPLRSGRLHDRGARSGGAGSRVCGDPDH
jgi:hypothetical protein